MNTISISSSLSSSFLGRSADGARAASSGRAQRGRHLDGALRRARDAGADRPLRELHHQAGTGETVYQWIAATMKAPPRALSPVPHCRCIRFMHLGDAAELVVRWQSTWHRVCACGSGGARRLVTVSTVTLRSRRVAGERGPVGGGGAGTDAVGLSALVPGRCLYPPPAKKKYCCEHARDWLESSYVGRRPDAGIYGMALA
eukprot:COSAG01_NODE_4632_length_4861_cov_2.222596_7_plen_201_part_00